MSIQRTVQLTLACVALLFVGSCQSNVGQATVMPTPSAAPTALPVATALPTVLVVPPTVSTGADTVSREPVPATEEASVVTVDAEGAALTLAVGQTFRLSLPDFYTWQIQVGDPAVLAPVGGDRYQARAAGETIMLLNGDPVCRQSNPPCMAPSVQRTLQVSVR